MTLLVWRFNLSVLSSCSPHPRINLNQSLFSSSQESSFSLTPRSKSMVVNDSMSESNSSLNRSLGIEPKNLMEVGNINIVILHLSCVSILIVSA